MPISYTCIFTTKSFTGPKLHVTTIHYQISNFEFRSFWKKLADLVLKYEIIVKNTYTLILTNHINFFDELVISGSNDALMSDFWKVSYIIRTLVTNTPFTGY